MCVPMGLAEVVEQALIMSDWLKIGASQDFLRQRAGRIDTASMPFEWLAIAALLAYAVREPLARGECVLDELIGRTHW